MQRILRRAQRVGLSNHETILVVLLAGLVFMVAFRFRPRHEHSPFALFGAAPGMSLDELRSAIVEKRHGTVECHPEFDVYRLCALKFSPDPGVLTAVVDPSKRLIVVQGVSVVGLETLHAEADSAQQSWSRVASGQSVPPLVEIGDTGAVRWTSPDRRWTAEQHFSGVQDPDHATQVILVDTKGVEELVARSATGADHAKQSGWLPPTAEEASAALEQNRANRKSDYGALATTLSQLGDFETAHWNEHHAYTDNIGELPGLSVIAGTHLEVLSASDSGWTARASNPAFPRASCIAVGGRVANGDAPVTAQGRGISTSGIICDPMPGG